MSRWTKKGKAPKEYAYIQPVMEALESELRERMNEPHEAKRGCEALWPVHQINWQRSRYVYEMYYKYKRIPKKVYDYCIKYKLIDANLIAKWKKPGYEKLCCTFAINPKNFNYGTVSICRVPKHSLAEGQVVESKHAGCRGCASGPGGQHNIFGNKYGQYLAAIQIAREKKAASKGEELDTNRVWVNEDDDEGIDPEIEEASETEDEDTDDEEEEEEIENDEDQEPRSKRARRE